MTRKKKKVEELTVVEKDLITNVKDNDDIILSEDQQKVVDLVLKNNKNVFIAGSAGTGKSLVVSYITKHTNKQVVICSPTAVAAMNIGGTTLHSFFKLPVSDIITNDNLWKTNRKTLYDTLFFVDMLIIDEVSMVRPDMLDAVDKICKKAKKNRLPFGGIQVVLVGDLYQLPPVITTEAAKMFEVVYGTNDPYFFDADAYHNAAFEIIELNHVFRQTDTSLLDNLVSLRNRENLPNVLSYFNTCQISDKNIRDNAITITPYRAVADEINKKKLFELNTRPRSYEAEIEGEAVQSKVFPAPHVLTLKKGALVIFNKNDDEYINGTSGIVEDLGPDYIIVRLLSNDKLIYVQKATWKTHKYEVVDFYNEKENIIEKQVKEVETGAFTQYPLQLGWSTTIHKAQGKTLDKVVIDFGRGAFAHGQTYVALSRTRNKNDIHLIKPIMARDIITDSRVIEFMTKVKK